MKPPPRLFPALIPGSATFGLRMSKSGTVRRLYKRKTATEDLMKMPPFGVRRI